MTPALNSAPLMRIAVEFATPQNIEAGPHGTRRIFTMTGGSFLGADLAGQVMPGGADWVLIRHDGVFQLDIPLSLIPEDGGLIYAQASGILDIANPVLEQIKAGAELPAEAYYFRTFWQFETSTPAHLWLNRRLAVGVGTRTRTGMSTELFVLR